MSVSAPFVRRCLETTQTFRRFGSRVTIIGSGQGETGELDAEGDQNVLHPVCPARYPLIAEDARPPGGPLLAVLASEPRDRGAVTTQARGPQLERGEPS